MEYEFEEIDTEGLAVEEAYGLRWREDDPERFEDYLKQNEFELLGGEQPTQLVYREEDEIRAEAWIDSDTAYLKIYREVFEEETEAESVGERELPLVLRGVMQKRPEISLDEWLSEGLSSEEARYLVDEEELVEMDRMESLEEGVPFGGQPKRYDE